MKLPLTQRKKTLFLFFIAGIFAALSVGSKFTGLISVAFPFILIFFNIIKQPSWKNNVHWLIALSAFLLAFISFYLAGWYLHFELLNHSGPGDAFGVLRGSFLENVLSIHQTMLAVNSTISASHHDASLWWAWPWMNTPIYYWVNSNQVIYLLGNPLIWWSSTLLFLFFLILPLLMKISNLIIKIDTEQPLPPFPWLALIGFIMSFLPLIAVSRVLFLYHYFTPLIFSIIYVCLWLERIGWLSRNTIFQQRLSVYFVFIAIISSFYFILPISYGLTDSINTANLLFQIFPSWR
jgi:dolichyl-phosphate-mannose--protein O-mannosyl transferase